MSQEQSKYKLGEFVTFEKDTSELRTWTMYVGEYNLRAYDYYVFTKTEKKNFVEITEKEVRRLRSAKVSYMLLIRFKKYNEKDGKFDIMDRYFDDKDNQPKVFLTPNKGKTEQEYNKFVEKRAKDIEDVEMEGSGWKFERVLRAYIKVEIYRPIRGASYLPLPAWLANKKAVINVKNKDNQCLKWAIRAALFPSPKGKTPNRTSSYPEKDGINYEGIEFPTPLDHIEKLEKQNSLRVCKWKNLPYEVE